MSEHTRPQPTGLHSHATAAIGVRTHRLVGRGADYAKLLWLVLLSHSRWPGNSARPVWACDLTLIHEMGLFARDVREAKRGLQRLADAGMIKRSIGHRPGARRPVGRVIEPALGSQVRVLIPDRHEMAQLWARCRAFRSRPCSAVTVMVAAYALACDAADGRIDDWASIGCRSSALRHFVGASRGGSWSRLLADLERAGLIRRRDGVIECSPPRS